MPNQTTTATTSRRIEGGPLDLDQAPEIGHGEGSFWTDLNAAKQLDGFQPMLNQGICRQGHDVRAADHELRHALATGTRDKELRWAAISPLIPLPVA
jgi:hypothetical protein